MRVPQEDFKPVEINIVPLIDVIFSILVFFIIASLVLTRSESLDVQLPNATNAEAKVRPDVTISITSDEQIAINEKVVAIPDLVATVEQVLADKTTPENQNQKRLVLISADLAITHGKFVEVSDALRNVTQYEIVLGIATKRS